MATLASTGFTPLDGVSSEADKLYQAMCDVVPGGTLTYQDLDRVLGRQFVANRTPLYTALKRMEKRHGITFRTIPRFGIERLAKGDDLIDHVKDAKRSARRLTDKAIRRSEARTDVNMSPDVRQELDRLSSGLASVKSALSVQRRKMKSLEEKVEQQAQSALSAADVKRMISEALGQDPTEAL